MSSSTRSKIIFTAGPLKNQEFELQQPETLIGREEPADILIDDTAISRRHASITCDQNGCFLEDLGSSNGTFLNGQPVKGRADLKNGDQIRLGEKTLLTFENPEEIMLQDSTGFVALQQEPAVQTPAVEPAGPGPSMIDAALPSPSVPLPFNLNNLGQSSQRSTAGPQQATPEIANEYSTVVLSKLKKNSIKTRFTMTLLLIFIIGSVLGGIVLWNVLLRFSESQITNRGLIMIDMMTSVRNYTSNDIAPLLRPEQDKSTTFISPIIPAFSARTVFDNYRKVANQVDFQNSVYKEAATNPTNINNLADEFEANLQQQMDQDANLKQVSDFRQIGNDSFYFIARPLRISSPTCLSCHTTPETAPIQLINSYGRENGFGWKLGQVVAVQMIYVPANQVFWNTLQTFSLVMGIFIIVYALVILVINNLLHRSVIRPVNALFTLANKVWIDQVADADLKAPELLRVYKRNDELGRLSQVFTQMVKDVQDRTRALREQVKSLQIEIDESRKKSQVKEIVETEFFRELKSRARVLREKRQAPAADTKP